MVKDLKKNLRYVVRKEIKDGVIAWKKSRTCLQFRAISFGPFLDFDHKRYWVARSVSNLTAVCFAPPSIITSVVSNLRTKFQSKTSSVNLSISRSHSNISAANDLKPMKNVSGWKFT
ncbi:hypothetical protein CY34DRAFT_785110, partial [Suillus luteus UH-Slu-Lm8-n1]